MIQLYRRTILNDCEHFLRWFEEEIKNNERFRMVYAVPEVLQNQMQFLLEQWFIVKDLSDAKKLEENMDLDDEEIPCISVSDIQNLIEQKFEELLMLVEMQLVMNSKNTRRSMKLKKKQ